MAEELFPDAVKSGVAGSLVAYPRDRYPTGPAFVIVALNPAVSAVSLSGVSSNEESYTARFQRRAEMSTEMSVWEPVGLGDALKQSITIAITPCAQVRVLLGFR